MRLASGLLLLGYLALVPAQAAAQPAATGTPTPTPTVLCVRAPADVFSVAVCTNTPTPTPTRPTATRTPTSASTRTPTPAPTRTPTVARSTSTPTPTPTPTPASVVVTATPSSTVPPIQVSTSGLAGIVLAIVALAVFSLLRVNRRPEPNGPPQLRAHKDAGRQTIQLDRPALTFHTRFGLGDRFQWDK